MFCCWKAPVFKDSEPLVVDLGEVLCTTAWESFRSTLGPFQRLTLKRKDYVFDVPENYFDFEDIKQEPLINKRAIQPPAGQGSHDRTNSRGNNQNTDSSGLLKGKIPSNRELTNPESITLDTEFSNETAERQMYKFRFEKARRTEIEVTFQKGFTFGGKANFSIKIPLVESGLETEMQYQVTKSDGQRFEESLLMEATSDIAVGPNSRYTANVQLEEKALHASFRITTRMSMPQKKAPVYIKRRSDGQQVFVFYVKNLVRIFKNTVPCAEIVKENEENVYDKIDFVVEGVVKGMLACNHRILLTSNESEELKKDAKIKYMKALAERASEHENLD